MSTPEISKIPPSGQAQEPAGFPPAELGGYEVEVIGDATLIRGDARVISAQTLPEGLTVKKKITFPYPFTVMVRVSRDGMVSGAGVAWGDISPQREKQIKHAYRAAMELIAEGREDYQSASEVLAELPDSPSLSAIMAIIAFVAAVEHEAWACLSPMATQRWGRKDGGRA